MGLIKWIKWRLTVRPSIKPTQSDWQLAFNAMWEKRALFGYVRANSDCTQRQMMPSKQLMREYSLHPGTDNMEVWAILEKYFNGELVEKDRKCDVTITEYTPNKI
jgi:hypothetical protein